MPDKWRGIKKKKKCENQHCRHQCQGRGDPSSRADFPAASREHHDRTFSCTALMKDLIHEKTGIQPVGRTQTGAWEKDEKEGEAEWSCYILTLNPPAPRVGGGGVENVGVKLRLRNCRGDREVVVRCNNFQFCFSLLKCILIGNKLNWFSPR